MSRAPEQHAVGIKKILAVGEDFALLATRAALLAKTNASVTCCNSVEFATELNRDRFDLVILCYSLGESVRQTISVDVHLRWPKARVLQITADPFPIPPLGDQVDAVTGFHAARTVRSCCDVAAHRLPNTAALQIQRGSFPETNELDLPRSWSRNV
jgi:hypothetical protein